MPLRGIPHSENIQEDALAALASSSEPGLKRVIPVEFIEHPSIGPPIVVNLIEGQDDEEEEGQDAENLILHYRQTPAHREMGSPQSPNIGRVLRNSGQ